MPTGPDEAVVDVDLARAQDIEDGDVMPLSFWNSSDDIVAEADDVVSPAGVERVTVVAHEVLTTPKIAGTGICTNKSSPHTGCSEWSRGAGLGGWRTPIVTPTRATAIPAPRCEGPARQPPPPGASFVC